MTGPVQLLVGLALLAGVVLLGWLVHRFTKTVVPYEADTRPDFGIHKEFPWPRMNGGGGWEHEDGRITRDREGKEEIR
jgi:hypothetical protein